MAGIYDSLPAISITPSSISRDTAGQRYGTNETFDLIWFPLVWGGVVWAQEGRGTRSRHKGMEEVARFGALAFPASASRRRLRRLHA